jgi:glutamine synthetase adenylyltransferase
MTGALRELAAKQIMAESDAATLEKNYEYLRSIESVLRRWENKGVASLPADKTEQVKLALRVGEESIDSFAQRYRAARTTIHAIYSRYMR